MMDHIKSLVDAVNRDLEKVTPKTPYVISSIKGGVERIAYYADVNGEHTKRFMEKFLPIIKERYGITNVTIEQMDRDLDMYIQHGIDAVDYFDKLEDNKDESSRSAEV